MTEKIVEVVGGAEFLLDVLGGELRAQVVNGLGEPVERTRNIFGVGEQDIAPDTVRAARQAQGVLQSMTRKGEWQTGFVGFV